MTMEYEGIAIVGLAAQLPSGTSSTADLDYASFWDFLIAGKKAYEPLENIFPDFIPPGSQVQLPAQGAFLKNATSFDNISLGISTKDARVIPYSARRLLDLSFQALLDSGIESRHRKIGCFMSGNIALQGETAIDTDGSFSHASFSVANRISYVLDLTGPSVYLDTACSSSLTALHLAIGAIERGDCAAALVGAAQINRDPFHWMSYVQSGVLSVDGMSNPLDAAAAGFGRGEGAVVLVLKPLKDAIRDHDRVYSVVLGSSISSTGSSRPLNVPNGVAQQECIREAYLRSGVNPRDADFVELHATGTSVGDPIEANAAGQIFATSSPVVFGTVKGNIGHLEVAAFLASIVKACLIFQHRIIPPTVNFSNLAASINCDAFRIAVPLEPIPLGCRSSSGRSIISLSGFGIGGAMGHVVLQAPPRPSQSRIEFSTAPILFLVGGLSSSIVDQISRGVLEMAADNPKTLRECAAILSRQARQLPWRKYFTIPFSPRPAIVHAVLVPRDTSPLAFVFSGQGPQHLEMGRQLFAEYPVFRDTIMELDDVYRRIRGVSLVQSTGLFHLSSTPTIALPDSGWPVTITLSAIAMVQMAMFDLLKSLGIVADMMLGHSAGETAILYACGAGPKEMAMEIAIARGEAGMCTESTNVGMAMLACNANSASELIACITSDDSGVLELSCFNAPDSIAVSGKATRLDNLIALAKAKGIFAQRIRTMVPGHSSLMDCIKDDYLAKMDDIFARYPGSHVPRIPVYSTCREEKFVDAFTASYFWDNCRNAVLFSKAISDSLTSSSPIFLEISCHAVLSSSVLAHGVPDSRVLCPMGRISATKGPSVPSTEPDIFLDTLGRLSLLGVNSLDLSSLYGPSTFKSKPIEHPLAVRTIPPPKSFSVRHGQVTADNNGPLSSSSLRINKTSHPDLAQNVINGEPILPATGFIELLLESGANFLWDVEFVSSLSLATPTSPLQICLQRLDAVWSITASTASREREHARGFMDRSPAHEPPSVMDCDSILKRLPSLDVDGFYASLEPLAAYGSRFQRVVRCHGSSSELIAEIMGPTPDELSDRYLLHPVIMDACFHPILHTSISKEYSKDIMYLPSSLEHFIFYRRKFGAGNWFSHLRLRQWTPESRSYDVLITDSSGLALCELRNLKLQKFKSAAPITVGRRFDLVFQPVSVDANIPTLPTYFPERTDKHGIRLLYEALDSLAVAAISKSLDHDLVVGQEESRHRYLDFARRALKKRKDIDIPPKTLQDLRDNWPYHFEITSRISSVHESVFETPKHAVNVLFSDDLMAKYYVESSQTSNVCIEATKAFSGMLKSLRESGKRVIKVLEVGAGTGLLTNHLIDELKRNPDLLVEYTVTDISYALVVELARNIAHGSVIAKAYDIGKEPNSQGIHPESYDVVVGLHALHAAPIVKGCLTSLQTLLVPGGSILTVELDRTAWVNNPGTVWLDFIFGSFPEWFGYVDDRDHCTMAAVAWKKQLEASGFINVQTCLENGSSGHEFFFVAQKPLSNSTAASDLRIDPHHIYSYEFGNELRLQTWLRELETAVSNTVYLLALRGRDADAAIGLCAALRQEIPLWDIRLVIFESPMDLSTPIPLLIRHMHTFDCGENVVSIDQNGAAHVMRVALSPPPSPTQVGGPVVDPSYISVRITHWAGMSRIYDGFIGQVDQSHDSSVSAGDFVCGVAEPSSAKCLRMHIHNIVSMAKNPGMDFASQLLGAIVSSLITWPSSGPKRRMAVAVEDDHLAQMVQHHVSNISQIQLVEVDFRDPDISERLDIVVSDSVTYSQYQHLRRWIPRTGKAFLWDELLKKALCDDPLYIRHALGNFCQTEIPNLHNDTIAHIKDVPASFIGGDICSKSRAAPPFRSDRPYLLVGGISGLGIDLAVWMYQHGARHLVITSRRGLDSLDTIGDALTLAKVTYLKSKDDLSLWLEQCDVTDVEQMKTLLHSLPAPIAGCFLMPMVFSDAPFLEQTRDTSHDIYNFTLRVLEVVSGQVEIESLDFFVAFSSIGGFLGIPGQCTYTSACTALDSVLACYQNAFSLLTPGIYGAEYLDRDRKSNPEMMSVEALWACLEDGLRKMDDFPVNRYIPDLDWSAVDQHSKSSATYHHLLPNFSRPAQLESKSRQNHGEEILIRVLELLEVSSSDFDVSQPITTYGLDSISATKLVSILRPYASFSQLQLLRGVTWSEIEAQLQDPAQTQGDTLPPAKDISGQAIPLESHEPSVVEICSGSGTPLIILPGSTGSVGIFFGLKGKFQGALWAIQITESTPLDSLEALVGFWKQRICDKWPHGPYRFAAFSASTLLGVALTKMMEDAGEEVVQLTFVDHCPLLWAREETQALLRERPLADLLDLSDQSVLEMLRNDPTTRTEVLASYLANIRASPHAPPDGRTEFKITRAVMTLVFKFLHQFYPADSAKCYNTFIGPFNTWLSSIKAPLMVLIAEHGCVHSAIGGTWPDLGASRFSTPVEVHYIDGRLLLSQEDVEGSALDIAAVPIQYLLSRPLHPTQRFEYYDDHGVVHAWIATPGSGKPSFTANDLLARLNQMDSVVGIRLSSFLNAPSEFPANVYTVVRGPGYHRAPLSMDGAAEGVPGLG
ncbi:hypothetical protein C8R44DRAFT_991421, partial [Mycena epipterygia]